MIVKIAILLALSAAPAFTQTDAARAVVLEAVANLAAGYQFSGSSQLQQQFTNEQDTYTAFTHVGIAGKIDAQGNYHTTSATLAAETEDGLIGVPPFDVEQVAVDDVLYLNFLTEDTVYEEQYPAFAPGWHAYTELAAELEDDLIMQQVLQSLVNVATPSKLSLTEDFIVSVTELEPETRDGFDLRVFEVELNALEVFASQGPALDIETLLKSASLIAASEFELTYTLWIGAEDGQLYQVAGTGRSFVPYLTTSYANGPSYDVETTSTIKFTLFQHAAVSDIVLPEEIDASE